MSNSLLFHNTWAAYFLKIIHGLIIVKLWNGNVIIFLCKITVMNPKIYHTETEYSKYGMYLSCICVLRYSAILSEF
jgi:hypothetical protein